MKTYSCIMKKITVLFFLSSYHVKYTAESRQQIEKTRYEWQSIGYIYKYICVRVCKETVKNHSYSVG